MTIYSEVDYAWGRVVWMNAGYASYCVIVDYLHGTIKCDFWTQPLDPESHYSI